MARRYNRRTSRIAAYILFGGLLAAVAVALIYFGAITRAP
jgi:hypothetical protein